MPKDIGTEFGNNLQRCRRDRDLSQEELAIRASLHRTEISLLERGERVPRIDTVLKLADSLGVPISELVKGIEWRQGSARVGEFASRSGGRGGKAKRRRPAPEDAGEGSD